MSKSRIEKAKDYLTVLVNKLNDYEVKLQEEEMTPIEYNVLEVGEAVTQNGEAVEDATYEVDGDIKIVVKDGVIVEVIKPEEVVDETETEVEATTEVDVEAEANETPEVETELESDEEEEVEAEEVEEAPVEEVEESEVVDVIDMEGLKSVLKLDELESGYFNINFEVVDGKVVWGDIYSENYKEMFESEKSMNEELSENNAKLSSELKDKVKELLSKEGIITELSKQGKASGLVQAPGAETKVENSRDKANKLRNFLNN